ncbi:PREDICTED: DBH-like monooxygenase protein 1 [Branchiostoma belcheri]|uniref:DBH-like monooxygenase protein 1 n=1 Tax=Branchiostoma belcheri TaxID=7741 RepID=A0A6P5ADS7_BRABE|nr:PREDICTED: DBH-like monooxygenase protein 1 [Branchiostoma belcheri]
MASFWARVWIVAAVTVTLATCLEGKFTHSAYLDPAREKYFLQWRLDADTITFRASVATLGYVGFGISPNGDMIGSDIVTGFVTDHGDTFCYDRYASARTTPTIDASQDWRLEASGENGTHTFLQFSRNLVLCDSTDRTIKAGTTRVIWAYHNQDPQHDTALMYHGETRGARSLMLLDVPQNREMPDDVQTIDLLNTYSVMKKQTVYWYRGFKVPDFGGKRHIIAFEPVLQPGHEGMIHHMDLYTCLKDVDPDMYDGVQHARHSRDFPEDWHSCKIRLVAWEVGGEGIYYPEKAGLSVGGPDDPTFFLMETHYNNPQHKTGIVDRSGLRVLYTSELRQHDLGYMQLGMEVARTLIIPPGSQAFVTAGTCYPDCLEKAMEEESIEKIHVIGVHFHTHLAGRKMKMRHVRNGVELPWIRNDGNFDFNFQQTVSLQKEVEVLKGDYLIVECTYNTTDRRKVTYGGLSTEEEMCFGHILHYPNMKLRRCKSNPHKASYLTALGATEVTFSAAENDYVPIQPRHMAGKTIQKLLHSIDWDENTRQTFQTQQRTGNTSVTCMKKDTSVEAYHQGDIEVCRKPPFAT